MQPDLKKLTAGIVAAAISAAFGTGLWFSLVNLQFFVFIFGFGFLVSLPVLVMAFLSGTGASIFTAISATFFLLAALSPATALLIALFFFAPAVFAGWLMGLTGTVRQKNAPFRYPLSPALFQLALVIAIATISIMLYLSSAAEAIQYISVLIDRFMATVRESGLYSAADQAVIEKTVRDGFIPVIASVFPVYGFLFHFGNLYLSMRLAEHMGFLRRPRDNWPSAVRMPPAAFVIFASGWILSLFSLNDTLAVCIRAIVAALGAAFLVSGLAFIHKVTQGRRWRIAVLAAIYIALLTLVLTPLVITALVITGLFTTSFSSRGNDRSGPPRHTHSS